uniref:Uncharacterized protein n=1 Tax=Alexandrium catenella TaxID=2925 RepID=A0A7S1RGN0_ALECA|mmetsp:Transcript_55828/g.149455  ORF Transcript_55828/g.149455 Transcript_55828/m.149455 type:complete len:139 (+) Transcript_55828:108-524(+)
MRPLGGLAAGVVWALACSRTAAGGDGGTAAGASPAVSSSASSLPALRLPPQSQRPPPCNASCDTEEIWLELQAERARLHSGGIMGDQVMLSLGGFAAIAVVAIGGVYRYRQRQPSGPSPQVMGRLLEEQELTSDLGLS